MGLYKLREWVGTVTGKGDRWGSTVRQVCTRLSGCQHDCISPTPPPPRLTARQADIICSSCCFCCKTGHLLAVCFLRPVPDEESASCVCLQRFCSAGFVFACRPLPAIPTSFISSCPHSLCFAPVLSMCARIVVSLQIPTCLQATRLPRRQQQRGPAVAARAPCYVQYTVAGAARLPLGSRHMETAFGQPMRRRRYP